MPVKAKIAVSDATAVFFNVMVSSPCGTLAVHILGICRGSVPCIVT
jgi:hypothetical protein